MFVWTQTFEQKPITVYTVTVASGFIVMEGLSEFNVCFKVSRIICDKNTG